MDIDIRVRTGLAADAFELVRDVDVVEPLAGVRVELLKLRGDNRAGEVVRHQAPHDAGLDDVLAHPREAGFGGLEVRRQHVAGGDAVLHHFDVANVRSEDREDLGAVDAGQEERRVRHLAQGGEELGREHVAVARHHRDHHAVRAAELLAILKEGLHVLVLDRHQLGEAGIDPQPGREPPHRQGGEHERREHEAAAGEQQFFDAVGHWSVRGIGPPSGSPFRKARRVVSCLMDSRIRGNDGLGLGDVIPA